MTVCLFIGPTIPKWAAARFKDAVILPPVAQGDVCRAAQAEPRAIGIVDGYFCGAPSVWHKEILWALSRGIHVFGSASMGALRAAELHSFGMRGIGSIFEAFRDGRLEDDDEVAVSHGPAELGYPALSEAMVNIRATLARAEAEGVLNSSARQKLEASAKALHFPERSWPALLENASEIAGAAVDGLREWLPQGRVDQKREDALEMMRAMEETLAQGEPPQVSFHFEWTHCWDRMLAESADHPVCSEAGPGALGARILEELRLQGPENYERIKAKALLRIFGWLAGDRLGRPIPDDAMISTVRRLRASHGLQARADLETWLAHNDLDMDGFERLVEKETLLAMITEQAQTLLDRDLLDELRLTGDYGRLAERAHRKTALLQETGCPVDGSGSNSNRSGLHRWYFKDRLGRAVPRELEDTVRQLGFATIAAFDRALEREQSYERMDAERPDGDGPVKLGTSEICE